MVALSARTQLLSLSLLLFLLDRGSLGFWPSKPYQPTNLYCKRNSDLIQHGSAFIVKAGAEICTQDDWRLNDAMRDVGLKHRRSAEERLPHQTGVWYGNEILITYDHSYRPGPASRWDSLRWLSRYG